MVSGIKSGWYDVYHDGITLGGIFVHARVYVCVRAYIGVFVCICVWYIVAIIKCTNCISTCRALTSTRTASVTRRM